MPTDIFEEWKHVKEELSTHGLLDMVFEVTINQCDVPSVEIESEAAMRAAFIDHQCAVVEMDEGHALEVEVNGVYYFCMLN